MKMERRFLPQTELSLFTKEESDRVSGYAARFDMLSDDLGGFREIIRPGAFAAALGGDVRALVNHDWNLVLGRTAAGTLRISEDAAGLAVEIDLPDTAAARDLRVLMGRGDVNQMSFGFRVGLDRWEFDAVRGTVRVIDEIAELYDVSVVTLPAYPQTEAALRSLEQARPAATPAPAWGRMRARADIAGL